MKTGIKIIKFTRHRRGFLLRVEKMDLFEKEKKKKLKGSEPLAVRMRPR